MEENLIAAIELGSSAISGVVGQKLANGTTEVLAYVSMPSESSVRHGVVYNTEKAASIIVELVEKMKKVSACDINMVYVAHNGKSLRSLVSEVERVFEDIKVVDETDVFSMLQECEDKQLENKSRLFLYPQEFTLDNKSITETDPIGVSCKTIKGNYLSVTTNANVTDDVERVFQRASVVVADSFVSIISAADYLLTEDDKQQGCALVDFGADTTTLAIYKNGILKYLRVLPLGSALITSDLAAVLKITHAEAEKLKKTYGLSSLNSSQNLNESLSVNSRRVTVKEISAVIEARNEEILRNLDAQIKNSGLSELLYAGMVVIGGGSNLRCLSKAIQKSVESIDYVRFLKEPTINIEWADSKWIKNDGSQLSLLSLLNIDGQNCCERMVFDVIDNLTPAEEEQMVTGSLFNEEGESAQEDRDREVAERKAAEEQARLQKQQNASEDPSNQKQQDTVKSSGYKSMLNRVKAFVDKFADKTEVFFDADDETDELKDTNDTN